MHRTLFLLPLIQLMCPSDSVQESTTAFHSIVSRAYTVFFLQLLFTGLQAQHIDLCFSFCQDRLNSSVTCINYSKSTCLFCIICSTTACEETDIPWKLRSMPLEIIYRHLLKMNKEERGRETFRACKELAEYMVPWL